MDSLQQSLGTRSLRAVFSCRSFLVAVLVLIAACGFLVAPASAQADPSVTHSRTSVGFYCDQPAGCEVSGPNGPGKGPGGGSSKPGGPVGPAPKSSQTGQTTTGPTDWLAATGTAIAVLLAVLALLLGSALILLLARRRSEEDRQRVVV